VTNTGPAVGEEVVIDVRAGSEVPFDEMCGFSLSFADDDGGRAQCEALCTAEGPAPGSSFERSATHAWSAAGTYTITAVVGTCETPDRPATSQSIELTVEVG
jgi:hypothetical protein